MLSHAIAEFKSGEFNKISCLENIKVEGVRQVKRLKVKK
jgi:hypothetical protein